MGNPKRFRSHEVVRMEPVQRSRSGPIDGPVEEIETEGQRHLQALLHKQLESKIPLQQYIHQKKEFSRGAEYNPVSKETSGMITLDDFKVLEQTDGYVEEMKACGLTTEEILYKLQADDNQPSTKKGKFTNADHEKNRLMEIERKIEEKRVGLEKPDTFSNVKTLSRHDMDLEKTLSAGNRTNTFLHKVLIQEREKPQSSATDLMSLLPEMLATVSNQGPSSLPKSRKSRRKQKHDKYKGDCTLECCVQDNHVKCDRIDICNRETSDSHLESDFNDLEESSLAHVQTCAEKPEGFKSEYDSNNSSNDKQHDALNKKKKDKKSSSFCVMRYSKRGSEQFHKTCNHGVGCSSEQFCNMAKESDQAIKDEEELRILNDIEGIPCDVIQRYKLSSEQVKLLPRFENYSPGEPSNVLYLKNLSSKVTEEDLAALFINLQKTDTEPIMFKLLSGRMKGQAFVTFPDIQTAIEALRLVHGYEYKGKTVIIQYGRKTIQ